MAASMEASQLSHFSYHGENKLNKETQALNLPSANDFPSNIVFKDVLALPRPLYSAQFSGSISDGSCLRVAYAIILEKYLFVSSCMCSIHLKFYFVGNIFYFLFLHLHFQGVSGAYSKSAAQRAYANCEAVPCDEFDTAFEIHSGIPSEKDRIGIFIPGISLRANPYRLLCSQRPEKKAHCPSPLYHVCRPSPLYSTTFTKVEDIEDKESTAED